MFPPTRLSRWLLLFSVLLFSFSPSSSAQIKSKEFTKFYSDIVITPDGKVDVTETITCKFIGGPWHGIYRTIPVEYARSRRHELQPISRRQIHPRRKWPLPEI